MEFMCQQQGLPLKTCTMLQRSSFANNLVQLNTLHAAVYEQKLK